MSKKQFPLIIFMQQSENDLKSELLLLQQAKKAAANVLSKYVEAVLTDNKVGQALLEESYEKLARVLFSESSELPPIRVSCGLDPVPVSEPVGVDEALQDEPLNPIAWKEQREIDGVQFLGSSEALDTLEKGVEGPREGELLDPLPKGVPVGEWVEKHTIKPAIEGEIT